MVRLRYLLIGLMSVGALLTVGCGDDGGEETARHLNIVTTSPQDAAVDVNLNPLVQVWFDQELDEVTVDSASFHVTGGVTERIEYDDSEKAIRLYLRELLDPETDYEVFLASTIEDKHGHTMAVDEWFAFSTGSLDCDHVEDYLEPNETIEAASEIDIVKAYPLLSSCGDGYNDYYRFVLNDTARVTARIEHVYSEDPQPGWYIRFKRSTDDDYTRYVGWIAADNDLNHRFTFLPGTYYIETGSASGADKIVVYDLIIQLSAPCPDDSLEDNDFIDEASPISPGLTENLRGCYRDRDCYSIRLENARTLTVTVNQVPAIGSQCTLEILGPDGGLLTGHDYTYYPAVETWTSNEDTTYYISATWWADNVRYTMDVDVVIFQ